jgi:dihydrofolate reductase
MHGLSAGTDTGRAGDWAVRRRPVCRPGRVYPGVTDQLHEQEKPMGKIIVSENVTLDGVVQDPTGEEGSGNGNWFGLIAEKDREEWAGLMTEEARDAEALLLGRRSDEWFAERWLSRTGPWADRLNSMPKYVVSSTVGTARWGNATVLDGDVVKDVSRLKDELAGDIIVYGSGQLVQTLLQHDLVDELRLTVYPAGLGSGERLFADIGDKKPLRLLSCRTLGDGLVFLAYEVVRDI